LLTVIRRIKIRIQWRRKKRSSKEWQGAQMMKKIIKARVSINNPRLVRRTPLKATSQQLRTRIAK